MHATFQPGRAYIGYCPRRQLYFVIWTTIMKLITEIIFLCAVGAVLGKFRLVLTQ